MKPRLPLLVVLGLMAHNAQSVESRPIRLSCISYGYEYDPIMEE